MKEKRVGVESIKKIIVYCILCHYLTTLQYTSKSCLQDLSCCKVASRHALKQGQWKREAPVGFVPVLLHHAQHYSNRDETVSFHRSPTLSSSSSSWDKHCSLHREKTYTSNLPFEKNTSLLKWNWLNHTGNNQKYYRICHTCSDVDLPGSVSPFRAAASFSHQKGWTSSPSWGRRMTCRSTLGVAPTTRKRHSATSCPPFHKGRVTRNFYWSLSTDASLSSLDACERAVHLQPCFTTAMVTVRIPSPLHYHS